MEVVRKSLLGVVHDIVLAIIVRLNSNYFNYPIAQVQAICMICKIQKSTSLHSIKTCLISLGAYSDIQQGSQEMGNVDMTTNEPFMCAHNKLALEFIKGQTLFNVEDITFPLSTHGMRIVDATGRRVKLAGGNWSGGHLCRECVDGLQMRPMRDIAMDIRYKFKMNCIRLCYSLQLYFYNKVVEPKYLKANPELIGKTALEIFDITVKTLTDVGLMVILNNHTSTSMWCCSNDDGDGLWWTYEFPQYKFFQNCEEFAMRYRDNPRVIGMDLRNELRKAHGMLPTWGDENPITDWRRAAYICGEKVLKVAPHWLILVGGLNYQLDLTYIIKHPLQYSVKNKLVYTGHFYGFSWPVPAWSLISYDSFCQKLFNTQTHVRGLGHPFFLGQFGNDKQDIPWKYLIRFLKETDIDWTYWALDGFKCDPDKDETYGMFTNNFRQPRHPQMLADLISVGPPKGTIIKYPQKQLTAPKLQPKEDKHMQKKVNKEFEKQVKKQVERQVKKQADKQYQQQATTKANHQQNDKEKCEVREIHEIPRKQKPKINNTPITEVKIEIEQINEEFQKEVSSLPQKQKSQSEVEKERMKHKIFDQKYKN